MTWNDSKITHQMSFWIGRDPRVGHHAGGKWYEVAGVVPYETQLSYFFYHADCCDQFDTLHLPAPIQMISAGGFCRVSGAKHIFRLPEWIYHVRKNTTWNVSHVNSSKEITINSYDVNLNFIKIWLRLMAVGFCCIGWSGLLFTIFWEFAPVYQEEPKIWTK